MNIVLALSHNDTSAILSAHLSLIGRQSLAVTICCKITEEEMRHLKDNDLPTDTIRAILERSSILNPNMAMFTCDLFLVQISKEEYIPLRSRVGASGITYRFNNAV